MGLNWSTHQQAFFDAGIKTDRNILVQSVAGSGKTTTAIEMASRIFESKPRVRILFLAFNNHIIKDIKAKLNKKYGETWTRQITVLTCHSYGMRTINGNSGGSRAAVKASKYSSILRYKEKRGEWEFPEDNRNRFIMNVLSLVDFMRLHLITDDKEVEKLAIHHDIQLVGDEIKMAKQLLAIGLRQRSVVDYCDMLYMPLFYKLRSFTYDVVFIDEAQDLSAAQRHLMLKAIKPKTGVFYAFGDRAQSINGFAGADSASFDNLLTVLPNTHEMPLTTTYRCGKNIVKEARQLVSHIEAWDGADDGVVDKDASIGDVRPGDTVLCRNTFPLVRLCLKYWASNQKSYVVGKDIGVSLINMVKDNLPGRSSKDKNTGKTRIDPTMMDRLDLLSSNLIGNLKKHAVKLAARYEITEAEAMRTNSYVLMEEKVLSIGAIMDTCSNIPDLVKKIDHLFGDHGQERDHSTVIRLSTIHRAKGLEADRVFITMPELMPSRFATQDWMFEQEYNLMYVAITRAKKFLGYTTDYDAYEEKKRESSFGG